MEYQLVKTRIDLFIVKIDYIWARNAAVWGTQSHILKIAVHYLYFTAIAAIEKAEMNSTRGYGSEKKSFIVFLWTVEQRHWTCGYRVAENKMRQDFATISSLQLLLAFHCCWQWWAHSPGDTYCHFNKVASIFIYTSIFYFMHIVIYQFGILRHSSPLCSNEKNIVCSNKSLRIVGIQFNKFQTSIPSKMLR